MDEWIQMVLRILRILWGREVGAEHPRQKSVVEDSGRLRYTLPSELSAGLTRPSSGMWLRLTALSLTGRYLGHKELPLPRTPLPRGSR